MNLTLEIVKKNFEIIHKVITLEKAQINFYVSEIQVANLVL